MRVFFFSPYFSSADKREAIANAVSGAERRARKLPRAARREAPDAGDLPHPGPLRRALGQGEEAPRGDADERGRARRSVVEQVGEEIERQTDREIDLSNEVDPEILGGLVLRVGNMVLDASLRSKLEKLRKEVASAAVTELRRRLEAWRSSPTRFRRSCRQRIEGLEADSRRPLGGRHRALGRRRHRPRARARQLHVARDARPAPRRHRPRAQPRGRQRRRRAVRRVGQDRRGRHGQAHRPPARDPGRRGAARPDRRPARPPARRQGRGQHLRDPAGRVQGAGRGRAPAGRTRRCRPGSRRSTG